MDTLTYQMPFREKVAWLYMIAITVTFGPYFTISALHDPAAKPLPNLPQLLLYGIAAASQVAILGIGHLVLKSKFPDESRLPLDERDREISRRSITSAYYALMVGTIVVGCVMPFKFAGWSIVNGAIWMIVLAEVVHYGVVIASYRSQR